MKLENLKSIRRLIYRNGNRILRVTIDESTYYINIYLFNSKGNRDYKLSYVQCFFTLMGSLIFPSLFATILGFINIELFTLSYIILLLVRLFMMCSIQLNGNRKYNQLEKEVKDEDFKLEFK